MHETVPCKECGVPIIWAENVATGKRIPLDARTVVYRVSGDGGKVVAMKEDKGTFYISHFATCSGAKKFSGKNRT